MNEKFKGNLFRGIGDYLITYDTKEKLYHCYNTETEEEVYHSCSFLDTKNVVMHRITRKKEELEDPER